jgi:AraC-like DNA-binding protein
VPVRSLLSLGGLDPDAFHDRDRVVLRSQLVAMINGLARRSGDATVGFRMAQMTDPNLLGPFGRSVFVGRTLGEALALQRRHMPWLQGGTSISMGVLEESPGPTFQWVHRMEGCDPAEARCLTEGIAAFFVRFVRAATGDENASLQVTLPHKQAGPASAYADALRCAVTFEKGADLVIRFDAGLLDRRNLLQRSEEGARADDPCTSVPFSLALPDEQLLTSLHRIIEVAALWGRPALAEAALTLGLSPRSLQRRLARLDTSFESVVDRWRRQQAETLLADPSRPRLGPPCRCRW